MAPALSGLQQVLFDCLTKAFADGVLEPHEQSQLRELYGMGKLTLPDVRAVFAAFIQETWQTVIADGVVTDDERKALTNIVDQLKLPLDLVPDDVKRAIGR